MLTKGRSSETVKTLGKSYRVSRQTLYEMAAKGRQVLAQGLQPGRPGPQPAEKTIKVEANRLRRGSVVLTAAGVSQRDVSACLAELLDTTPSVGWVNGVLSQVEVAAAEVNQKWQPQIGETLAGDEIYANGQPNLLVVGNDSLYIYALTCWMGRSVPNLPAMPARAWRRGSKPPRWRFINWIGIICCDRCGAKPPGWKSKPMPPCKRSKTEPNCF
jgi:hypothetical protein